MKINLVNRKFGSFQRQSYGLKGFNYNQTIPTNEFFLFSLQNYYLSSKHIDLITGYLKRKLKKSGNYQFIYPCDLPITKKPTEVGMGKGKGSIIEWCTPIKKGLIFFKLTLKNPILINTVISYLKSKLPFSIHYSYSNHIIHELNPKLFNFNVKKLPIYQSKLKKKGYTTEQN